MNKMSAKEMAHRIGQGGEDVKKKFFLGNKNISSDKTFRGNSLYTREKNN